MKDYDAKLLHQSYITYSLIKTPTLKGPVPKVTTPKGEGLTADGGQRLRGMMGGGCKSVSNDLLAYG